ncbi:hypothetical protein E2562_005024 [Oryza meyeriana var. granulata]|uniref:Late embryogenesis abundant protein LEA-2 subgroup domain-containing protein n=1 Tax=Oryza meyeriana var. granulata TaxID=110450 RepID=A0A6G1BST7_9ORYZ|nr:hypothetical protein E2562_005024 [Oryza meyeriana var. granulata]
MEKKRQGTRDMDVCSGIIGFAVGFMMLAFPICVILSGNPKSDHYSMGLVGIDGLDDKTTAAESVSPAFNLTLSVGSRHWVVQNCFSHGQVTVSYAGVPMGEGRVRGFCAEPRSAAAEVNAVARGGKAGTVTLPDGLRRSMEAELRWGAAEFDVEARLFRDGDTSRPVLLLCKVGLFHAPPLSSQCQAFTDFVI